jgi:tRNA pseudouridine38/39 synthase
MKLACSYFVGKHDFKHFCKFKPEYEKNGTVRHIFKCSINDLCVGGTGHFFKTLEHRLKVSYLEIKGSGFLWHMVRFIMSILKVVGRGQALPELVKEMLDVDSGTKIIYTHEDPEGLILYDCHFEGVTFECGDDNSKRSLQFWASKMIQKKILEVKILNSIIEKYENEILGSKKEFEKVENSKSFKRIRK